MQHLGGSGTPFLYTGRTVFKGLICQGPMCYSGPGSSVGVATSYGLDGLGFGSWWGTKFSARPDRPWGPTQPPVQ